MRVLSTCSGISAATAATAAWKPLGWTFAGYAEPGAFPSHVLNQRCDATRPKYLPEGKEFAPANYKTIIGGSVPNFGDIMQITDSDLESLGQVDLLEGGTPCFPSGTRILTSRGFVAIEDVKEGDVVLTHKQRWRKVVATMQRMAQTVKVKGQGHHGLITTEEHPFWSRQTTKTWNPGSKKSGEKAWTVTHHDPEWADAKDMKGRLWAVPADVEPLGIPPFDVKKFETLPCEMTPAFFRFVGAWLGDGWFRKGKKPNSNRTVEQVFVCAGKYQMNQLADILASTGMQFGCQEDRTTYKFKIGSKPLVRWLNEHFGEYCDGKTFPAWAFGMPKEYRQALFDGYLFADGCHSTNPKSGSKYFRFTTVSRDLAIGIRLLAASLGMAATEVKSIYKRKEDFEIEGRKVNDKGFFWQISVYPKSRSAFSELGYMWGRVRSVEPTGQVEQVFNFEVEEDNSYVADGIVVHNCQAFSIAGLREGLSDERGNLTLEFVKLAHRMQRINGLKWVVWENVKGVLQEHDDNPFGCFLGAFAGARNPLVTPSGDGSKWPSAGHVISGQAAVAWRVIDAKYFATTPQRRARVFAVVRLGDGVDPGEILFEREGEVGPPETCGAAGQEDFADRAGSPGSLTAALCMDSAVSIDEDGPAFTLKASNENNPQAVVHAICNAGGMSGGPTSGIGISEDGDPMYTVVRSQVHGVVHPLLAPTLLASGCGTERVSNHQGSGLDYAIIHPAEHVGTLMTHSGASKHIDIEHVVVASDGVSYVCRRLMPVETERLQGFEDGWTDVPFKGKPVADGPRYKACGNSMCVPVIRWIGERLNALA